MRNVNNLDISKKYMKIMLIEHIFKIGHNRFNIFYILLYGDKHFCSYFILIITSQPSCQNIKIRFHINKLINFR